MECPYCRSGKTRKSRRGNAALVAPLRLLIVCLRCHTCGRKFYRSRVSWNRRATLRKGRQRVA